MELHKGWRARKVVVVGAGAVGSTFAYSLAQTGLADEIVLTDANPKFAQGQVLDLLHGQPFFPTVHIRVGEPADYADAQVIVVTAGAKQRPGQSRLELLRENAVIIEQLVDQIVSLDSEAVLLLVTNPVDVLTYVAAKRSGWPSGRVIGSGTVLDSARLRHLLGRECGVDVHNVHAYVLGEHGDSEFVAWSLAHIGGVHLDEYCPKCGHCDDWRETRKNIDKMVRDSAYHIIDYKGSTHFAVGLALVRIVGSILRSQNSVLTVSTLLDGEYGLHDVCLGVPSVVSGRGVSRVLESRLSTSELELLNRSARVLKDSSRALHEEPGAHSAT